MDEHDVALAVCGTPLRHHGPRYVVGSVEIGQRHGLERRPRGLVAVASEETLDFQDVPRVPPVFIFASAPVRCVPTNLRGDTGEQGYTGTEEDEEEAAAAQQRPSPRAACAPIASTAAASVAGHEARCVCVCVCVCVVRGVAA